MIKDNQMLATMLFCFTCFTVYKLLAMEQMRYPVFSFSDDDIISEQKIKDACLFCENNKNIIIVADDTNFNLVILKKKLTQKFPVITFDSAQSLIKLLRSRTIENFPSCIKLVVMDYNMAHVNGLEAMEEIERDELLTFLDSNDDRMDVLAVFNTTDTVIIPDTIKLVTAILPTKNDTQEIFKQALESPRKQSNN